MLPPREPRPTRPARRPARRPVGARRRGPGPGLPRFPEPALRLAVLAGIALVLLTPFAIAPGTIFPFAVARRRGRGRRSRSCSRSGRRSRSPGPRIARRAPSCWRSPLRASGPRS